MPWWAEVLIGVGCAVLICWLVLVVALAVARPGAGVAREAMRLLPDTLRLVTALTRDRSLPRGVRVRLWLLLGYLASPIDLVPDFIPVLGYADDVVVTGWVLRSVIRRAGVDAIERHWRGTATGLAVVLRCAGYARNADAGTRSDTDPMGSGSGAAGPLPPHSTAR
jgi:uncharacterized membrane protein YkvA (DUF1232 family)